VPERNITTESDPKRAYHYQIANSTERQCADPKPPVEHVGRVDTTRRGNVPSMEHDPIRHGSWKRPAGLADKRTGVRRGSNSGKAFPRLLYSGANESEAVEDVILEQPLFVHKLHPCIQMIPAVEAQGRLGKVGI
jgi:hypothetical protein